MVKLTLKKINLILLGLFVLTLGLSYIYNDLRSVSAGWEYRMAIFSSGLSFYYIIVWVVLKFRLVSPKFFVLLSMWLFHISLVIVMGFKLHEYDPYIMLYRYGGQNSVNALLFSNIVITFYVLGLVLFSSEKDVTLKTMKPYSESEIVICRKIGVILFFISIFPTLYTNYIQINAKVLDGYSGTMSADTSFYGVPLGWFTKMFLPSILLILASYKNHQKIFFKIMIIVIFYYVIFMFFTGRKGNTIQTIAPLLVMYWLYFKPKINIVYILFAYLGTYIISIVTQTRSMSINNNFWYELKRIALETNPLADLMYEMGGTIKAVIQMQLAVPDTGTYQFGLTYIIGIIVAIADGVNLGIFEPLKTHAVFAYFLSLPERGSLLNASVASMGGSSIAEWWWNFGWFSIVIVMVFSKLILNYEKSLKQSLNNPIKLAIGCSFLYFLLRYTRGYITDIVWDPLFIYCTIGLMYIYFKRKSRVRRVELGLEKLKNEQ
ncbi:hypothetical protein CHN50_17280 [Priestia aryabhattai]|nr:hypothetical protein CHN50_17280 [Priestia aryabhattai]